ncbi:hypothetical protein ECC02_013105 [Trypanosoma cruzi]|uniref:Uncharacterized protein n=1 Tax=Trypanosoma cruzi TaxID=5693 RepID=A0A7J6XJC5_TRYCR|nr:hypothetical protein ECC02_013105 [Trypanosoma cruzi]
MPPIKKAEWVLSTTTQVKHKTKTKKPKRGTTSAHTLTAPVKQNTHTHRERERSPTQCNKNKTETVTVLRPCSQAGRQRCVSCKREHQRACMGVHAYIQWAHYVCASWDEVRARVHARGHTQRVSERRVCVRAVHGALSLTLTRPPPQQQPHTQEEEAKEGRWCGRQRWCCRHCRLLKRWHLYQRQFRFLRVLRCFSQHFHAVDVVVVALVPFLVLCCLRVLLPAVPVFFADLVFLLLDVLVVPVVLLIVVFLFLFLAALEFVRIRVVHLLFGYGCSFLAFPVPFLVVLHDVV